VVYDDGLFLYSNHESDPIQGAANAWDLVRVHKFGHLDENVRDAEDKSPSQLPSYKEMVKLAQRDPLVAAEEFAGLDEILDDDVPEDEDEDEDEGEDSKTGSDDRFADLEDDDEDEGSDDPGDMLDDFPEEDEKPKKEKAEKETPWQANFRRKANGELDPIAVSNITLICENDKRIKPCLGFNEFTQDPVILKPIRAPKVKLPSPEVDRKDRKHGRRITDADDRSIMLLCSANAERGGYESDFSIEKVQTGVLAAGKQNPVHPVKDFIEGHYETWKKKGSPRGNLERLAIDFLGCPDTPFHRESARMFLVAAVARIYEPGAKFDQMVILEGETGSRKSTFWQVLFGGFCNELKADLADIGRFIEDIRGVWCKEMAEMDIAKRADANTLKMQLSSQNDTFRLAYGRREQTFPRQVVFVGTSNERDYLKDPTSNRRYWIWRTIFGRRNPIDIDGLKARLWQFWGEAYALYLEMREAQPEGELWLDLRDKKAIDEQERIAEESRKRTAAEEIALLIEEWLDKPHPADDVMKDERGLTLDGYADDQTPMVRNMTTAKEAFIALRNDPVMHPYRNADVRTFGKALSLVSGWMEMSKCRRHGQRAVWYKRTDGPDHTLWIPAPEAGDEDDMLS
jgi:predicted P-loop ATPase